MEVATNKGISQSTEKIHISQSAMTQAIAKLEKEFKTELFTRDSRGMLLTRRGQLLYKRVVRCLNFLDHGIREAIRSGNGKLSHKPQNLVTNSQLRALVAIEDKHSFTLAAKSIHISQPSLHRAARDLESQLAVVLFEKTNIGISLTKAALTLSRAAKLAFSELRQAYEDINETMGIETGYIAIGSMPLARTYILPNAINLLVEARPKVSINVIDGPYEDLMQHLIQGDIDFLIGALRGHQLMGKEIIEELLFATDLSIVADVKHPLASQKTISLAELAEYPWVLPRKGTPTRSRWDAMFDRSDIALSKGIIECSSQNLIRQLLLGSERLTFISRHQIEQEENNGLFVALSFKPEDSIRPIGLTYRRDWHPTSTQKLLLNHLRRLGTDIAQGYEGQ